MALTATFQTAPNFQDITNPWHYQLLHNVSSLPREHQDSAVDESDIFAALQHPASPGLLPQESVPTLVQPRDLYHHDEDASSSIATSQLAFLRRAGSIDPIPSPSSKDGQQPLRRMSLAAADLNVDSYRPRNISAKRKRSNTGRIKPRSDKHARDLELNRKAATKCRNRQKAFIEQLQHRCKREKEKMHIQKSLVSALHDEVVALRNEALRQSVFDCRFLSGASMPMIQ